MPEEIKHKNICQSTDTIGGAFEKMDLSNISRLFVVDQSGRLVGMVEKILLQKNILEGTSSEEKIEKVMDRFIPFVVDTDTQDEIELRNKIIYLKKSFSLSDFDVIPICNSEMMCLGMSDINTLLNAESVREQFNNYEKAEKAVKNICIMGGGGYLGTILAEKLLLQGYSVRILDIFTFGKEPVIKLQTAMTNRDNMGKLEIYEGDMRSMSDVIKVLEGIDAVVILGAVVGDPASSKYPISTFEVNYLSTQMIAETCAYLNINRLLFASTCSVYGQNDPDEVLDEQASLNPVSHYARTKINAEQAILQVKAPNFAPTIMRMSTLYGPSYRMRYDLVVNTMMMKSITTKKITVFGGEQWRPLLSVSDAAEAFIAAIKADIGQVKRKIYNVGDEKENYQIKDLGHIISQFFKDKGHEIELDVIPQDTDQRNYKVSFAKIKEQLNYQTKYKVADVLEELYKATVDQFEADKISDPAGYNVEKAINSESSGKFWD